MRSPAERPAVPAPIRELPADLCRQLTYFFTDLDDTLTTHGMIPARSFSALWDLADAGLRIVAVTGRPAGWCDHIARMWPVAGVVGENGALTYCYDRERRLMKRTFADPALGDPARQRRLREVAQRVQEEVPGTALAADQPFRLSDVAIDYREDVPPLSSERIDDICRILRSEGMQFKVSSIHVNFWMGSFDKMSGVRRVMEEQGSRWEEARERSLFIGDSPNDEPLFAAFPCSIAVANLRRFLDRLTAFPQFITESESAEGFQEAAALILRKRRAWSRPPASPQ
jgi:HAD superfamily hydrolase (TIGR01484 family)